MITVHTLPPFLVYFLLLIFHNFLLVKVFIFPYILKKIYNMFTFKLNHSNFLSTANISIMKLLPLWFQFRLQAFRFTQFFFFFLIYYMTGTVLHARDKEINTTDSFPFNSSQFVCNETIDVNNCGRSLEGETNFARVRRGLWRSIHG